MKPIFIINVQRANSHKWRMSPQVSHRFLGLHVLQTVRQLKLIVTNCEISLFGLSNLLNRLLIHSGAPLSSLLRDRRRTEELHRAAEKLRIAQSAISHQIKTLEEELEVKLLLRTKRSVKLTAAGQAFLREANDILNRVEQSRLEVRRAAQGETGTLSIGFFKTGTLLFLPELIHAYRTHYPSVRIHLHEQTPSEQLEALKLGRIDVGFMRQL